MERQQWYLLEDLILLSLFDAEVSPASKCRMMNAAHWTDSEKHPPKRVHMDITDAAVQQTTLECDIASMSSKILFIILDLPDSFLPVDPTLWSSRDDFMAAEALIKTLQ